MRRLLVVLLAAGCSEPDISLRRTAVVWMEWPAVVSSATPFSVHLIVGPLGCERIVQFLGTPSVDQSAVTFEPYFLLSESRAPCLAEGRIAIVSRATDWQTAAPATSVIGYMDTSATVPGLAAPSPRTYELRAAHGMFVVGGGHLPIRTFGEVTIGAEGAGRTNAGGEVFGERDVSGCHRIHPTGSHPPYVVENPVDTARFWSGFVRGYLYDAAAPICGETRVFHLVTRN
jgi:hypothetical protein